ncbi:acetyltransferase [Ilyonectria robusta]|uniref:acetyltransferase n=1 Tax=Ilyonectria robusta TaxID=1079257 RepID=UPI001E8CEE83|nr:acetyltransferase [Ilyonectria robusta]KAH8667890.1 acetyltransferase [Ilyonectria robusta]
MTALKKKSGSPGMPVTIRKVQLADAPSIAKLGAYVFTATFGHSVEAHELQAFLDETYTVAAITQDIQDENKHIIVATGSEGEILGFSYLNTGSSEPCIAHVEDTVELQRIYVHPSGHGKGIGGLLSSEIHEMARERGYKNIWLGVWEENFRALSAYEKWGYRRVGHHDFVVGTVVQRDNIMLKSLLDG